MIGLIKLSYSDAFHLVRTMLPSIVCVVVIATIASIAGQALGQTTQSPLGATLIFILASVASAYFAAPFNVALLQALIGRQAVPTRMFVGSDRARLYFAWAGMITLVLGVLDVFPALVSATENTGKIMPGSFAASLVTTIVGFIISVRLATLLPGVAVEGQAMTLRRALGETSGRFWFITFASVLAALPLLFIMVVLLMMAPAVLIQVPPDLFMLMPVLTMPITFAFVVIYLAVSARLYMRFSIDEESALRP